MVGGVIQIVSKGIENLYITDNPEITLFKVVYRRHSNFTSEDKRLNFITRLEFGKESICPIKPYGDLLSNLTLVLELPKVDIYYRHITPKNVADYLAGYGITWATNNDNITDADIANIITAINDKIAEIEHERETFSNIIDSEGEIVTHINSKIIDAGTTENQFYNEVVDKIIDTIDDENEPMYKLFSAMNTWDGATNDEIFNMVKIKQLFIEKVNEIITVSPENDTLFGNNYYPSITDGFFGQESGYEMFNYLFDELQLNFINPITFLVNLNTEVNIEKERLSAVSMDIEQGPTFDALKKMIDIMSNHEILIKSIVDSDLIVPFQTKLDVIETIYYNDISNLLIMKNMFSSLIQNLEIFHHTKFTKSGNIFLSSSLFERKVYDMIAFDLLFDMKFETDARKTYIEGIPTNMEIPFDPIPLYALQKFYLLSDKLYFDETMSSYSADKVLWDNLAPTSDGLTTVLSAANKTDLKNIYVMDWIPLHTNKSLSDTLAAYYVDPTTNAAGTDAGEKAAIAAKITEIFDDLHEKISDALGLGFLTSGDANDNNTEVFYLKDKYIDILNEDNDTSDTVLIMSSMRRIDGVAPVPITYGASSYDYMTVMKKRYYDELKTIIDANTANTPESKTLHTNILIDINAIINLYFTPLKLIPSVKAYKGSNYTQTVAKQSIQYIPVISSLYNYIYTNQIKYFNDMYVEDIFKILNTIPNYEDIIRLKIYFEWITPGLVLEDVKYYFTDMNTNNIGTNIDAHLDQTLEDYRKGYKLFRDNVQLFRAVDAPLNIRQYHFETFENMWTELSSYVDRNIHYDPTSILTTPAFKLNYEKNETITSIESQVANEVYNNDQTAVVVNDVDAAKNLVITYFNALIDHIDDNVANPAPTGATVDTMVANYIAHFEYNYDFQTILPRFLHSDLTAANIKANFLAKINELFTPTALYDDIGNITTNYNGFNNNYDVFSYVTDKIFVRTSHHAHINNYRSGINQDVHNEAAKQQFNDALIKYYTDIIAGMDNDLAALTAYRDSIDANVDKRGRAKFAWIERPGYHMIDKISMVYDGEIFDCQTGALMDIRNKMNSINGIRKGYEYMIGNIPELIEYNTIAKDKHRLYIPLNLFFNHNRMGNAQPIIAMNHTKINLHVKLKTFEQCSVNDGTVAVPIKYKIRPKIRGYVLADYKYIENVERNHFVKSKLEYLIETMQHNSGLITYDDIVFGPSPDNNGETDGFIRFNVDFKNICKEIIWTLRFENNTFDGKPIPHIYTPDYDNSKPISSEKRRELTVIKNILERFIDGDDVNKATQGRNLLKKYQNGEHGWFFNDPVSIRTNNRFYKKIRILFNDTARENYKNESYYNYAQGYKYHTAKLDDGIYSYSFSVYPEKFQPSGGANLGAIASTIIQGTLEQSVIDEMRDNGRVLVYDVYGVSYNHQRIMSGITGLAFYS